MWSMKNKIAASAVRSVSPCEQGSCKNCDKPGLLVHPFRYSAFCSDDESIIERIPPLRPASGGSLPELTQSKYALRMMREGYIYVVLVRNGLKYIDSYYVRPSGRLMRFRETPPERKTSDMACQRMANSPNALMVAIDAPEEVSMSYWLFTPDPLSNSKEQELLSTAEELLSTGALQGFSPQRWVNQRQSDQYMLSPATISYFVLEYMVASQIAGYSIGQVPMIRALDEQPFPALCDSQDPPLPPAFTADQLGPFYQSRLNASLPVLRESVELLRSQDGVGIALQDPIGITQELNAWRNRAMEGLEEWMHTVDKFGVDNQWKYLAARQYADIREGLLSGRITASERATIEASNSSIDKTVCDLEAQRGMPGALDPGPMIEIAQATKDSDPFGFRKAEINAARSRVLERFRAAEATLDGGQTSILADFDARAELCEMAVQQRAANHLAWLKGNMLILALRFYDKSDFIHGWAFAIQVGLATNGMDCEETSKQVIDDWWRSIRKSEVAERADDEQNLIWRVFTYNNISLSKRLANALEIARLSERQRDAWEIVTSTNEAAGKALELFDKANSALQSCEDRGRVPWFKRNLIGVSMAWYASWGRIIFSTATSSRADQAYLKLLIKLMQLRMGSYAQGIPIGSFHSALTNGFSPQLWRAQVSKAIREGVELELTKGSAGSVYKGRVVVMATLFESVNLIVKGKRIAAEDPTGRDGAEFIASGMALAGGVIAITESASGWVSNNALLSAQMTRFFSAWGGRLALYGGLLGSSAGLIGALLDLNSAFETKRHGNRALVFAYSARAFVASTAAVLSSTVGFAGSAPFLKALIENSRNPLTSRVVKLAYTLAGRLLAQEALMLLLRVWIGRLAWAAVALTVVIVILSPEDFEDWCRKSVFRKYKGTIGYRSCAQELSTIMHLSRQG